MNAAADIATLIGTALAVWAALSRVFTQVRRRHVLRPLSKFDVQIVSIIGALLAAAVVQIIILQVENQNLLVEHSHDLDSFNAAAHIVETYAASLQKALQAICSVTHAKCG